MDSSKLGNIKLEHHRDLYLLMMTALKYGSLSMYRFAQITDDGKYATIIRPSLAAPRISLMSENVRNR